MVEPNNTFLKIPSHPDLEAFLDELEKWRYCFAGGDAFKMKYLEKISDNETDPGFYRRRRLTPVGAFAAEGILQIADKIFQYFPQIKRLRGPQSYQDAIDGKKGGVDLKGSSMDAFMGLKVVVELLLMGKVGVYVDAPALKGQGLLSENKDSHPYLYMYRREDIVNWVEDTAGEPNEFKSVLLCDHTDAFDNFGFPADVAVRHRRIFKENGKIYEQIWDKKSGFASSDAPSDTPIREIPGLTKVPFVLFEISDSLMRRVADHQIALLNIDSLDINFLINSNHPFYVEESGLNPDEQSTTIEVGTTKGRRFPRGATAPQYINASSESLKASLDKQEQIKIDIQRLLNLTLSQVKQAPGAKATGTINPKVESKESAATGLSAISLTLEAGEQQIASHWASYSSGAESASVIYPKKYESKPDALRLQEANEIFELVGKIPSIKGQKAVVKQALITYLADKVDASEVAEICKEVDEAVVVQMDADTISKDIQGGLLSPDTGCVARLYPKEEAKKAEEYQARRAAMVVVAQTQGHAANAESQAKTGKPLQDPGARGAPELSPTTDTPQQGQREKQKGKQGQQNRQANPGGNKADRNAKPGSGTNG